MTSITSKGYTLTASYTELLGESSLRYCTEFINTGSSTLYLVVGGTLGEAVDANAIPVAVNGSYVSPFPLAGPVFAKGDTVIILANQ